jgi:hypothetical protein
MFARSLARVQQHILDDGVGAFAVLHDLVKIVARQMVETKKAAQAVDLAALSYPYEGAGNCKCLC